MDYIKKFDFISYKAHFTFNDKGDKRYKTLMGGILSLISLIISFSFITYFLYRLIYKEDASIMFYSERDSNINISYSYKLPFMFRLSDSYSIALNQQNLYNISLLVWYSYINNETNQLIQNYDKIIVEKCNIDKHFNGYKNYFNNIPDLESYFCPRERLNNQSLYGIYGNHKPFIYYVFYFSKCNNLTNNNLCLTNEEIEDKLNDIYLDIKFLTYSIPKENEKKMDNIIVKSDRFLVSNTVFKRLWFFFNYVKYRTDNGLLFSSYLKNEYHQYENSRIDIDLKDKKLNEIPGTFLTVTILNSGNVNIYKKNYLKIQDYLATIGGIIKAITYICHILNYYNSINSYYAILIKDFLIENQIKKKKYKIENIDQSNQSNCNLSKNYLNIPTIPKTHSTPIRSNKNLFMIKLKEKEVFEKKFQSKFLHLNFTTKSYNDKKEIEWNIKIINKKLNIINILNNLEQINKIKKELDIDYLSNQNISPNLSIIPENEVKRNNFILDNQFGKKKRIF